MKKILFVAIMSILITACSDDETAELLQPTLEKLSMESVGVGEQLTIPGKDFDEDGEYTVMFNDLEGKVTEVKPTYLKVTVPENATSGDITLTYDGITTKIGTIVITKFPTIESFSLKKAEIGDIITITGTDFVTSETYTVKFQDLEGEIIEITSTTLKVKIPEGTASCEVSLTYKDETKVIGNISILESFVYGFYKKDVQIGETGESVNQIVKIDKATGSKELVADLSSLDIGYYESLVYDSSSKNIIGLVNDNELIKVNIESGEVTKINIASDNESIKEIVIGDNDNLYGFYGKDVQIGETGESVKQIVKIDKATGLKELVADLSSLDIGYYESLVYDSSSKSIIGLVNDNELIKVNIESGEVTKVNIASNNESIKEIVIGDNDDLYGFYGKDVQIGETGESAKQIVKIDKATGSRELVADLSSLDIGYYEGLVYDSASKSIIGLVDDNELIKVNIESGEVTKVNIASNNESIKEIVSVIL